MSTHTVGETDVTPAVSHQITFNSSLLDILCVDVSILDNDIIDGAKTFNVVLTTDNELVMAGDPAVVKVIDDDCKCKSPYNGNGFNFHGSCSNILIFCV